MTTGDEKAKQASEAAAIRRRWITLGEVLAVLAVLISGLTLWNSYSERSSTEAARARDEHRQAAVSRRLLLKAERNGKRLNLAARDEGQAIQSQTIVFPASLGAAPIDTLIEPRIEAAWIRAAVKKAKEISPQTVRSSGDARLPVAITTRFVSGGESLTDTAIYDVGYKYDDGGLLGGSGVELHGLSLVERVKERNAGARLDALWKARQPIPARQD